jgi:Transposase IS66 family
MGDVRSPPRLPRHQARPARGDHAKELSADTTAIVTPDRWWAYSHLPSKRRQLCWAHPRRDFKAHAEGLAPEKEFGETGPVLRERVSWAWEVYQHTRDRRELKRTVRSPQRRYKPIIRTYTVKRARNKRCRGMARNLLKAWPALWTFAAHDGAQPTNNHAERAPRSAVIYRKLCPRQPVRRGRATHLTTTLRAHHLPATTTLAVRLPHRRHPSTHPRRPGAATQLSRPTEHLQKSPDLRGFSKPTRGLEPRTPSLRESWPPEAGFPVNGRL